MKSRPWPIKILFLCHLLAPLINLVIGAWYSNASIYDFTVFKFYETSLIEKLALIGLVPLCGIVIFLCKRWSYFAYLGLMTLVFSFNFFYWQKHPEIYSFYSLAGFFVINVMVVGYFLIPAVRMVYFNERLRWWESEPRYVVGLSGQLVINRETHSCKIENISRNGARVSGNFSASIGDTTIIEFNYEDKVFSIQATVLNREESEFGLCFQHDRSSEAKIKSVIRKSFAKDFAKRTPDDPLFLSFFKWLKRLLLTGQGLLPNSKSLLKENRPETKSKEKPEKEKPKDELIKPKL